MPIHTHKGIIMRYIRIITHLIVLAALHNCLYGFSMSDDIGHRIIRQSDGLTDNKIQSLLRDTLGTLWVGTAKGLNRIYEGRITDYNHDSRLRNKPITFICRDSRNNIWLSVQEEGLFKYDYHTDSFHEMKINDESIRPEWFSESDGCMWFCSKSGITKFDHNSTSYDMHIPRDWKECRYNGFCMVSDSTALVSSLDGCIYRLNLPSRQKTTIYNFNEEIHVKDIYHDSQDKTWISIHGKGLFCFSHDGLEISFPHGTSFFNNSIILDIQEHNGILYIATDGEGIFCMDLNTREIRNIKNIYNSPFPEELNSVSIIYFHDDDMLLGTIRHGIIFQGKRKIRNFKDDDFGSRVENGPNRSVVACMSEDADGKIWIGCDGGGLFHYDPVTGHIRSIDTFKREKVVALVAIDERQLLVSLYSKGIYKYDIQTGNKAKILIEDRNNDERILGQDIIIGLERVSENEILVLAKSVYIYDIKRGTITDSGIRITGTTNLNLVYRDQSYTWLHSSYELFKVDNKTKENELLLYDRTGTIRCIKKVDGQMYIISSYSLSRINPDSWTIDDFPFHYNGKLMPVIEADGKGNLYVATKNDIFCIRNHDPQDYIKYDFEVGSHDFLHGASLTSSTGIIYFGGNSGLCQINPCMPDKTSSSKSIHFLRITVNGHNIPCDTEKQDAIRIPWNYESIFIDISSEGDDVLTSNQFRYTISEYGKSSVIYSDSRLSLPVTAPGKYKISIAFLDESDNWIESDTTLHLTITPPWWKNFALLWGILLTIAMLTFSCIYLYHKYNRVKAAKIYRRRKEKLAENKMEFITNISHELKTPLTLIYNPLKRILERNEIEETLRKDLSNILGQSKYMTHLINMVLDSRKLEEGFGTLNIGTFKLRSWIEDVCGEFASEFDNKSIRLKCETSQECDNLNFDESKFHIILSNLLMNAWKYSEPGTTVSVVTSKTDGRIRISVVDEGIGISPEDTERIFNRFTQGNRAAKGFGLGLAYTKLLVETHPGGKIGAYPNIDKGSTFWFEIPESLQCQQSNLPADAENALHSSELLETSEANTDVDFEISGCTVLIVEDETDLQGFLRKELSSHFKDIYTASDGVEALNIAKNKKPDIIISDVMMPNKNGYELCSDIKKDILISHIPIILLTALNDAENRKTGYKSGADIYLTKPFETSLLIAASRNVLKNRAIIKERYKNISDNVSAMESTFSDADEKFLTKLDSFIEENLSNDSLNAQMCIEYTCMGRATFYKKIKELTGLGIMEYVTRKRMYTAAGLLTKTRLHISEIAQKTGYPDNQYFSKVFKQNFGMSPREYRNKTA